jgi:hypothetical protein
MRTPEQLAGEIEARAFVLQASGLNPAQARKQAGREIAAREKAKAAGGGAALSSAPPDATSSLSHSRLELAETFNRWIHHIWSRTEEKMARYKRKSQYTQSSTPTLTDNPVVVVEPSQTLSADPKLAKNFPAPLIISDFSSAKLIPNSLYASRYIDQTTENWKESLRYNEQVRKEREARSLQLQNRNKGRYVG